MDTSNDDFDDFDNNQRLNYVIDENQLILHKFVFDNDLIGACDFIKSNKSKNDLLSMKDMHGNTPLHLACMLGRIEFAKVLVEAGATVKIRNKQMWTPLNEAVSYGNRDLIKCLVEKYKKEVDHIIDDAKPKITHALKEMVDFYVEIKWDFESWIPLVSRFLPSDLCKLYKKGTKMRIDCTLGDFGKANSNSSNSSGVSSGGTASPFNWQRGDLSFIFDIEKIGQKNSICFLDNKRKTYMSIEKDMNEEFDIEKEIDFILSKEMFFVKSNTRQAHFVASQIGWFNKRDRIELCNGYMCQFYDVNNLFVISKLRNEHLTDDDIRKNEERDKQLRKNFRNTTSHTHKSSYESISNDTDENNFDDFDDFMNIDYKPSLPAPSQPNVTWKEYINAVPGDWPILGRKLRLKESRKEFKAQLAMSQEFPLSLSDLNKLLDALAPLAKFRKLKEFLTAKLPPGFPVKIDIPVVPTVTAKVNFQNFKKNTNSDDNLFRIPSDYVEEKHECEHDEHNKTS